MTFSLRTKLIATLMTVVLLSVAIFTYLLNIYMEKQFQTYLINRQEEYAHSLTDMLGEFYGRTGSFDAKMGFFTFRGGLRDGYIILIHKEDGSLLWDPLKDKWLKSNFKQSEYTERYLEDYKKWVKEGNKIGYLNKTYPIFHNGNKIAQMEIGYIHKEIISGQDMTFLQDVKSSLFIACIICLMLALMFAVWLSNGLIVPIKKLAKKAEQIGKGDRTPLEWKTISTTELDLLSDTLNNLCSSLEKQEMLRKQMTADLSHELRTPLATLQSHLEALMDGIWEATPERLASCHQEVMRLSRMIQQLRQLNNLDEKDLVIDYQELDLDLTLLGIVTNFHSQYEQKNISLALNCPDNLQLTIDSDKLTQIMVNLLSNSWKYTPKGGAVSVDVIDKGDKIDIAVKDNGEGIAEYDLPHVFERLYRGDKSRSRETGGSGIGLAVTKALVEIMHGEIMVESILDEGSIFTVSFPKKNG